MTIQPVTIIFLLLRIYTFGDGPISEIIKTDIKHSATSLGIYLNHERCDEQLLAYASKHNLRFPSKYEIKEDTLGYVSGGGKYIANNYDPEILGGALRSTLKCIPVELETLDKKKFFKEK